MPIDLRRRDEIAAAVAAYDAANPKAEGFYRKTLPITLRRLVEAGFLSRHRASPREPYACLHLPVLEPVRS